MTNEPSLVAGRGEAREPQVRGVRVARRRARAIAGSARRTGKERTHGIGEDCEKPLVHLAGPLEVALGLCILEERELGLAVERVLVDSRRELRYPRQSARRRLGFGSLSSSSCGAVGRARRALSSCCSCCRRRRRRGRDRGGDVSRRRGRVVDGRGRARRLSPDGSSSCHRRRRGCSRTLVLLCNHARSLCRCCRSLVGVSRVHCEGGRDRGIQCTRVSRRLRLGLGHCRCPGGLRRLSGGGRCRRDGLLCGSCIWSGCRGREGFVRGGLGRDGGVGGRRRFNCGLLRWLLRFLRHLCVSSGRGLVCGSGLETSLAGVDWSLWGVDLDGLRVV